MAPQGLAFAVLPLLIPGKPPLLPAAVPQRRTPGASRPAGVVTRGRCDRQSSRQWSERGDQNERDEKERSSEHRQPKRRRRLVRCERFLRRLLMVCAALGVVFLGGGMMLLGAHSGRLWTRTARGQGPVSRWTRNGRTSSWAETCTEACGRDEDQSKLGMLFAYRRGQP
jgi:hypothetical protein